MNLELLGMSQEVSFKTGAVLNFLIVRLPNGNDIRLVAGNPEVEQLLAAMNSDALPSPPLEEKTNGAFQKNADAFVFGATKIVEKEELAPAAPVAPSPQKKSGRARLVGKDELGYPIMSSSGVSPTDVTGEVGVSDEDGVRQI